MVHAAPGVSVTLDTATVHIPVHTKQEPVFIWNFCFLLFVIPGSSLQALLYQVLYCAKLYSQA